jgi:hypothetical protein
MSEGVSEVLEEVLRVDELAASANVSAAARPELTLTDTLALFGVAEARNGCDLLLEAVDKMTIEPLTDSDLYTALTLSKAAEAIERLTMPLL